MRSSEAASTIAQGAGLDLQAFTAHSLHAGDDLTSNGREKMLTGSGQSTTDQHQLRCEDVNQRADAGSKQLAVPLPESL